MIPLLLSVSALLAYFLGCVDTAPIACEKFLKRDLRSFGRGKSSLEALYRETGIKGVAAVYVPEVLKIAVAVIAGGLLLSIKGHAAAGRMGHIRPEAILPIPANQAIYDRLYDDYRRLYDYFGRGENDAMKRLKAMRGHAA